MYATTDQEEYIEKLVDHIGFKDSPLKDKYIDLIHDDCRSFKETSYMIDRLLEERRLRFVGVRVKKKASRYLRITDISDFAFCPVSYAIKATHILPQTKKMKTGEKEHEKGFLEKHLEKIKHERKTVKDGIRSSSIPGDDLYGDMLQSEIIHRGHDKGSVVSFINQRSKITGNPDYIFIRKNKEKFIVEEKHTWFKSDLNSSWFNNTIQVLGYVNLLDENFTGGYIVYFQHHYSDEDRVSVFSIKNTDKEKEKLREVTVGLNRFRRLKKMVFDPDNMSLKKCFGCSVRPWCSHKSGKFETVTLPYYNYYKGNKELRK